MVKAKKATTTLEQQESNGRLSLKDMMKIVNKKAGTNVAFDLHDESPTEVKQWIPTGSRWLDSIICRGKLGGIPCSKITECCGLEASGKSYLAAQIAANAQKMGIDVIYFDSESAIDPTFLKNAGCDLDKILYVQAKSCEFVLATIEELLGSNTSNMLFVWDSLAFTPTESDVEGDYDPQSSMSVKARVLGKGFPKLIQPLANHGSTLLVLNQLKTRIAQNHFERADIMAEPYFAPGGKAASYAYSLRIWLTDRKGKDSFVYDDKGYRIGTEVKATIKKSRFGTQGRICNFKIIWGADDVSIQDEESWIDAIKESEYITTGTSWTMKMADGSERKFRSADWLKELKDPVFRQRVFEIMDEHVIRNFDTRQGAASAYYSDAEADGHGDSSDEDSGSVEEAESLS